MEGDPPSDERPPALATEPSSGEPWSLARIVEAVRDQARFDFPFVLGDLKRCFAEAELLCERLLNSPGLQAICEVDGTAAYDIALALMEDWHIDFLGRARSERRESGGPIEHAQRKEHAAALARIERHLAALSEMRTAPELQVGDSQSALDELVKTLENAPLWYRGHLSELRQPRRGQLPTVGRYTMAACLEELPAPTKPAKVAERILGEVFTDRGFSYVELQPYVNKARARERERRAEDSE